MYEEMHDLLRYVISDTLFTKLAFPFNCMCYKQHYENTPI